jgi:GT2 family glycosyltransferase
MTAEAAGVTVVICTYTEKRWEDIVEAVESCEAQSLKPAQIVLVADHNPRLLARLAERFPQATVVENPYPQGLAGARNAGIAAATGRLVVFLDDDAIAHRDWLKNIDRHCHSDEVMGAGGRVDPLWLAKRPGWFPDEFLWVLGCTYAGVPREVGPVRNLMGGCMGVRKTIYDATGGYRVGIGREKSGPPLGCEETEFCIRARQSRPDGQFIFDPASVILHKIPAERMTFAYFRSRCYAEGYSKALVSTLVGARDGLSSERRHVLATLPRGVARNLGQALAGDPSGLMRAGAIVAGLGFTVWGYLRGRIRFSGGRLPAGMAQPAA